MLRAFLEPKALAVNAELCTSLCLPDVILAAETGPHQLAKACNYSLEGTTPTRCWSLRICLTGAGWGGLVIALFPWEQKNALIEGKQLLATSYYSQWRSWMIWCLKSSLLRAIMTKENLLINALYVVQKSRAFDLFVRMLLWQG